MNQNEVEVKLIEVLKNIQIDSGYDGNSIEGTMCPLSELEGFDSMLCPVAITILASELGVIIPDSNNIFLSKDGKSPLTISESAAIVCQMVSKEEKRA